MANTLYDEARQAFLNGQINWESDAFKVVLVNTAAYTVNVASHKTFSDVASSSIVAGPVALPNTKGVAGAADGDDVTFTSVTNAKGTAGAIIIYRDVGVETNNYLIAYIDTATGLPITPNGGDIIVTWDNGVNRIFRL